MHKCFRCGTEFEGGYCPECGTQWQEEKHCPSCGAMLAGSTKFCNNCGYSFVESAEAKKKKEPGKIGAFFSKVWAWIKTHLKIVIPTACALVAVIVILSLIPTFILMSVNGTYYAYTFDKDGELVYSEDTFITLSTGKWKDEEGKEGKYKLSGSEITLTYIDEDMKELGDLFGEEVEPEEIKGTVKNGVLKIVEDKHERTFAKKNHKHDFDFIENDTHQCACGLISEYTEGLAYKKDGGSYTVSGIGKATKTEIIIPSTYKGRTVTSIGEEAFYSCSNLTSITIPNSVTSIGDTAFGYCEKLTSIIIPNSVVKIGRQAFFHCSGLTEITIPNSITSIESRVFEGCSGLTSITIPNSVTNIGENAFFHCSGLAEIAIPSSVTNIGKNALNWCDKLASIIYSGDIKGWCKISGLNNLMVGASNKTLTVDGQEITGTLVIPDGVTSIGDGAFDKCSKLMEITIPNSVTSIGDYAFAHCSGLTSITFEGTKAEWKAIEKDSWWNYGTDNFTVQCFDGRLDEDGNEIQEGEDPEGPGEGEEPIEGEGW